MKLDNKKLLETIVESYNYEVEYLEDGRIKITDYDTCDEYETVELALIDWLPTLIESEKQYIREGANISWFDEIQHIKEIKNAVKYNELSINIDDYVTYGAIPKHLYKTISVYIDEQIRAIELRGKFYSKEQLVKASIPVEFILQDNNIKYIKVANLDYIKRMIDGDFSELENDEVDVYDGKCRPTQIGLMPSNSIEKFAVNIPILIALKGGVVRTRVAVNPLYLI